MNLRTSRRPSLGSITEPARTIDVVHETDVLVVGSGPAGLAAALAAARAGVEVTLVERFGCFGGNITTVGVEGFAWYRHEQTVEADGIGREFEQRAYEMGAAVPESQSQSYEIDAEGFKVVADVLVQEAGIHPMLHRSFVSPVMDGDTVIGIVTESKAGREAILARRVIDATGDADIAHRAGASTHLTPRRADDGGVGDVPPGRCRQAAIRRRRRRGSADLRGLGRQRRVEHRDVRQGGRDVLALPAQAVRGPRSSRVSSRPTSPPSPAPGARSTTRAS